MGYRLRDAARNEFLRKYSFSRMYFSCESWDISTWFTLPLSAMVERTLPDLITNALEAVLRSSTNGRSCMSFRMHVDII